MKGLLIAGLALGLGVPAAYAKEPAHHNADQKAAEQKAAQYAPDNTGRNARDRHDDTLTATDQSENEADRTTTQKIRQAVVADDSLSMLAHNVKIITIDGTVTLRGPVKTAAEKTSVAAKAAQVAGADKVRNQLEIAPE